MENAGTEGAKGIQNQHAGGAKRFRNAKKILNRGNEPKDLLKKQDLAFSAPQNKLFFECKKPRSKRRSRFRAPGPRCQVQGEQVSRSRCQVSGTRSAVAWEYNASTLLPPRTRSRECGKRDKKPATGQAAQRIKRHPGTWFLLLDPRLSTSRLREIERTMRECV